MLMKTAILYFTTCFHGFGILRHVDPFVRMLHIYDKLDKSLHADPNINYNMLEKEIINSMETHMQKKTVKFNRRKHKRDPWITLAFYVQ